MMTMATEKSLVIDFTPVGTVEAMHFDSFPLGFLGRQKIERASELKFDEEFQSWAIHVANGHGGFNRPVVGAAGFASYEEARDVEVAWFNECRRKQVTPESLEGIAIVCEIGAKRAGK